MTRYIVSEWLASAEKLIELNEIELLLSNRVTWKA